MDEHGLEQQALGRRERERLESSFVNGVVGFVAMLGIGLLLKQFMAVGDAFFFSGTLALIFVIVSSHRNFARLEERYVATERQLNQLFKKQKDS